MSRSSSPPRSNSMKDLVVDSVVIFNSFYRNFVACRLEDFRNCSFAHLQKGFAASMSSPPQTAPRGRDQKRKAPNFWQASSSTVPALIPLDKLTVLIRRKVWVGPESSKNKQLSLGDCLGLLSYLFAEVYDISSKFFSTATIFFVERRCLLFATY